MIKAKLKSTGQPVIIVDSFEDGKYKVTFEDNPAVSKYVRPSELEMFFEMAEHYKEDE